MRFEGGCRSEMGRWQVGNGGGGAKTTPLTVSAGGQAEMPTPRVEVIKLGEST